MKEKRKDKKVRIDRGDRKVLLEPKFIFYREKKIPILMFQKAGHEKILKFLVKGIPWR